MRPGKSEIQIEKWKCLSKKSLEAILKLFNDTYNGRQGVPTSWKKGNFIHNFQKWTCK